MINVVLYKLEGGSHRVRVGVNCCIKLFFIQHKAEEINAELIKFLHDTKLGDTANIGKG